MTLESVSAERCVCVWCWASRQGVHRGVAARVACGRAWEEKRVPPWYREGEDVGVWAKSAKAEFSLHSLAIICAILEITSLNSHVH